MDGNQPQRTSLCLETPGAAGASSRLRMTPPPKRGPRRTRAKPTSGDGPHAEHADPPAPSACGAFFAGSQPRGRTARGRGGRQPRHDFFRPSPSPHIACERSSSLRLTRTSWQLGANDRAARITCSRADRSRAAIPRPDLDPTGIAPIANRELRRTIPPADGPEGTLAPGQETRAATRASKRQNPFLQRDDIATPQLPKCGVPKLQSE